MRISDWSSDVCSSDLPADNARGGKPRGPSALDELLRRGRGHFGGGGGGGGGMNLPESARLWKWGILVAVLIWALVSMFHIVPPEKEGVVTRLGSYSRTVGPGVKWTLTAPFAQMRMEDVSALRNMQTGSPDASPPNFLLTPHPPHPHT